MYRETSEVPLLIERQLAQNGPVLKDIAARLQQSPPPFVLTCGRGSSDHAASFAKYAIETRMGVAVASYAPSLSSIYRRPLSGLRDALFIAISQSGQSPDLLASMQSAKEAGALVVALLNNAQSPAAKLADYVVPLLAGPEQAVAATKSYVASLSAIVHLLAVWSGDVVIEQALRVAPTALQQMLDFDYAAALPPLLHARSLYCLGRGLTFGIAAEAALKLKETSGIHAECFSTAEVQHGPLGIVEPGFPMLLFVPDDEAQTGFEALLPLLLARGVVPILFGPTAPTGAIHLPLASSPHALVTPLLHISGFYRLAERLALARGRNPDTPPGLTKVTATH